MSPESAVGPPPVPGGARAGPAEAEEASAEVAERREASAPEDLRCFISFAGPGDGVLGLGLYGHHRTGRTPRQRRAELPPDFNMVGNYVHAEAFNEGQRRQVREVAWNRLQDFMSDPALRTAEASPSLGSLVHCLLFVEDVTWEDSAPALLPEALRRHAVRQRLRGKALELEWSNASKEELVDASAAL
uniref:Uncharacterized protein n=1 Tax=Alexandrium monilatum TaxID=311494 RepID=A0A7S4RJ88_9DINO